MKSKDDYYMFPWKNYKKNNLTEDAQKSLNAAGPRLYSAVEYALKYYLKIDIRDVE